MSRAALPALRASCARIALSGLGALAALRAREDVLVARDGECAWVHWRAGDEAVLRAVLAVPGAELFERREDAWHRLGARLPSSGIMAGIEKLRTVIPLPREAAEGLGAGRDEAPESAPLRLVPSGELQPTRATLAPLASLKRWAETATTAQLEAVRAARCGDEVLLTGENVPLLAGGERFWGASVLVPLGERLEPELTESDLRALLGAPKDALVVVRRDGSEIVPASALRELSRASARLA